MLSPAFDCSLVEEVPFKPCSQEKNADGVSKATVNASRKSVAQEHAKTEKHTVSKTKHVLTDQELFSAAEKHDKEDRLLVAARILQKVQDKSLLTPLHEDILRKAQACEKVVHELKSPVSEGWTKQGESHGHYDSIIYFKMDPETNTKLTARIETPIDPSLLVPFLSVLNETDLYTTWLPSWKTPIRLGVKKAVKLRQTGRVSQVILVETDMPWPMSPREAVISALAFDDIAENGDICIKLHSLREGEDGVEVPHNSTDKNMVRTRVDMEGGFLFQKCPANHPALQKALRQDMILVCFSVYVDVKVQFLPHSVINFIVRTVIGRVWNKFLIVAENIRDGKRPEHAAAIAEKRESLYDWVDERVKEMLKMVLQEKPIA